MSKDESRSPSYYAIIPASVRYDKTVSSSAKLLYGEISALCNQKGFCWAENAYFQELYGVGKNTIIRWINELESGGYIQKNIQYDGKKVIGRCLSIAPNDTRWSQKCDEGSPKNDTCPGIKNDTSIPINNTINNNTINKSKKERGVVSFDSMISAYTDNAELKADLAEFIKMRKLIRKPLTNRALELTLKDLDRLGSSDCVKSQILQQSIKNSWQGVFPLKQDGESVSVLDPLKQARESRLRRQNADI